MSGMARRIEEERVSSQRKPNKSVRVAKQESASQSESSSTAARLAARAQHRAAHALPQRPRAVSSGSPPRRARRAPQQPEGRKRK